MWNAACTDARLMCIGFRRMTEKCPVQIRLGWYILSDLVWYGSRVVNVYGASRALTSWNCIGVYIQL